MRSTLLLRVSALTLACFSSAGAWAAPRLPACMVDAPPSPGPSTSTTTAQEAVSVGIANSPAVTERSLPGPGGYVWDVDVTVSIDHAASGDLALVLIAPNGLEVTLSTGNGAGLGNVFNSAQFDDSADVTVNQAALAFGGGALGRVIPEGALTSLQGIYGANGPWTLRCTDTNSGNNLGGTLLSWKLDFTLLNTGSLLPRFGPWTGIVNIPRAIPNNGTLKLTDWVIPGGTGSFLAELRVYAKIDHTQPGQLDVLLMSNGLASDIPLAMHRAGPTSNAYFGVTWFDAARKPAPFALQDQPTSDAVFAAGLPNELVPEGALGQFIGVDPLAGFGLRIFDTDPSGTPGTLVEWGVTVTTYDKPTTFANCIQGVSANGCVATLAWNSSTATFEARNIDNNKTALIFYGIQGQHIVAWGSASRLCVKAPFQRTQAAIGGGMPNGPFCDGAFDLPWSTHLVSNPDALGNSIQSGDLVTAQLWWRDPQSVKTTQLSNVVTFGAP